ncbi:16s rrna methyltransferase [Nannochloropsis oceanica]
MTRDGVDHNGQDHKTRRRDIKNSKKQQQKETKHKQHKHSKQQRFDGSYMADQDGVAAPRPPTPPASPAEATATLPSTTPATSIEVACKGFTAEAKARFSELTPGQWAKLEALGALVQEWNGKVNVISRKDIENVLLRHVLPCMGISKLLAKAPSGTKLMDVGTGGGFPGLPLAICCPHVHFWLVDSIGKKVKVVGDMAARLGLKNVTAWHTRVEEVREKFHYITGRSVTAMPRFVGWVQDKFIVPSAAAEAVAAAVEGEMTPSRGILYIKGGINEENQEEDLGGWAPTARYPISELIGGGVYEGDKSVLHFSVQDLQRGPHGGGAAGGGGFRAAATGGCGFKVVALFLFIPYALSLSVVLMVKKVK